MDLQLSIRQTQTLSPQLMQSMEVLQMGSQELLEYIENQVQENPTLEMADQKDSEEPAAILQRKLEWLASTDVQNRTYHQQDSEADRPDPISNYGNAEGEGDLYHYLLDQLTGRHLDPGLHSATRFLVECLDRNGWLDEPLESLAQQLHQPLRHMERALTLLQSLEPAGVGARNLSECLLIQLGQLEGDHSLACAIAQHHLEPLSKNRYGVIAKATGTTLEEVHAACDEIRSLNPRPASGFAGREEPVYIHPDLFILNFPDHFEVLANDYFFPSLNVSGYYSQLLQSSDDTEVKDYLCNKLRQAKWVVRSIEQRRSTLLLCAQCLLARQEAFFRYGGGHLKPLTLADVAQEIGVHESTVSRAIKDKYLQCASGVYPISHFFSRSLGQGDEAVSPDGAKALLKELIAGENKQKPLSDQKLTELLTQAGFPLSRRTVAKYRDELHIPSTTGRKEYT